MNGPFFNDNVKNGKAHKSRTYILIKKTSVNYNFYFQKNRPVFICMIFGASGNAIIGQLITFWKINGNNRFIIGIRRLIHGITRLFDGLTRLINGWGAQPGPGAAASPPNPPTPSPAAALGPRPAPQPLISRVKPLINRDMQLINRSMILTS